jgi:alpha-glucosidase
MLGAFQPFYRDHSDLGWDSQEFYLWPLVTKAAKYAIAARYRLLDYFYTAVYQQTLDGTPAINPLFYIYPKDKDVPSINLQYFFGDCILVSPVTKDEATNVDIYLPDDVFYDFETGKRVRGEGKHIELKDVPFDRIPLHVRGGCIVPLRAESANTTTELRKKDFELFVAPGLDGKAEGSLYVDDGVSLDGGPIKTMVKWTYDQGKLETAVLEGTSDLSAAGVRVQKVTVLGEDPLGEGRIGGNEL